MLIAVIKMADLCKSIDGWLDPIAELGNMKQNDTCKQLKRTRPVFKSSLKQMTKKMEDVKKDEKRQTFRFMTEENNTNKNVYNASSFQIPYKLISSLPTQQPQLKVYYSFLNITNC